jgi:hypothetical protein
VSAKLWISCLVVVLLAAVAGMTGWSLVRARNDLQAGRAALQRAADAVADRDLQGSVDALATAHASLQRGARRLDSVAVWPARAVPVVGRNVAAARDLAIAGADASRAGGDLLAEVAALPDGLATFAPRDGRLPVDPLGRMRQPLASAQRAVADARARAADTPSRGLVAPLSTARDRLVARLATVHDAVRAATGLAKKLPGFLGTQQPRRYLVGAQNLAELRGTGGLIGAISVMTVEDGAVELADFRSVGTLTRNAPEELPAPSPDFAARYARYDAGTHGSNINMTPHVPTAAKALERLYAAVEGREVHGTILVDPVLFEALVQLTGPVTVPGVGELAADEVVDFVTRQQYALLGDRPDRKQLLGEVAKSTLEAFLDGAGDPRRAVAVLGEAVRDGHLRVHAADEGEQAALAAAGVAGTLADPAGDYLAVIANNAAGHKGDPFYERRLEYTVRLRDDGSARATLTMRVANQAPTDGFAEPVLGANLDAPGDNRTIWSVYCAAQCRVSAFRRDGESQPISVQGELGRTVASTVTRLASGEATTLTWRWELPRAWQPPAGGSAGRYQLTVEDQPHLMDSSTSVRVQPPEGFRLESAPGSALTVSRGGVAGFEGRIGDRRVLAAEVVADSERGVVERARRALNRPLAELVS